MILPRRLMMLDYSPGPDGRWRFCEEDDPKQAMNYRPKGYPVPDAEAERIGLKAYLDETGWGEKAREKGERKVTEAQFEKKVEEAKAVAQSEVEDKAVAGPGEVKEDEAGTKVQPEEGVTGVGLQIDRGTGRPPRRGGSGA